MPQLIVLCGLPGAGKTEIAKIAKGELVEPDISNPNITPAEAERAEQKAIQHVRELLESGRDVVYEARNLKYTDRTKLIRETVTKPDETHLVCIFVQRNLVECMQRLEDEGRYLPIRTLLQMHHETELPGYAEGWNQIITVTATPAESTQG